MNMEDRIVKRLSNLSGKVLSAHMDYQAKRLRTPDNPSNYYGLYTLKLKKIIKASAKSINKLYEDRIKELEDRIVWPGLGV